MMSDNPTANQKQIVYEYIQAMHRGDVELAARILLVNPDIVAIAKKVFDEQR